MSIKGKFAASVTAGGGTRRSHARGATRLSLVVKAVDGSIERRHEYVDVLRNRSRVVRLPRRAW